MKHNFKRFLSLVVALVMVFGMFPMNVFATEGEAAAPITGTITEDTVWSNGDVIGNVTIAGDVTITVNGTVSVVGTIKLNPDAICNVTFNGENDAKLIRDASFTGQMFYAEGVSGNFQNLTFNNITLDGGAVWIGDVDKTLNRGTTNEGVKATGSVLYMVYANAELNNSILQNHDDSTGEKANAVFLRYYSTIEFNDSVVKDNYSSSGYYSGGVVTVRQGGTVKTYNTEVCGNAGPQGGFFGVSSTGSYGGICEVYNSKFHNNYSDAGAVFDMQCNSKIGYLLIDGCEFYENASKRGLIYEHSYSRPVIIKDSTFRNNECALWDCHADPVLDLSGKIVIKEDADYTNYLYETALGIGGALSDGAVIPISDASYAKLMANSGCLMTEVPTDNYYNPASKYTIQTSDMEKMVWNNPDKLDLIKTDVDGNGMLDVVPASAATTTTVLLNENFQNSTETAEQHVSDVVKNVPVAVWFHEGFYFTGWAEDANGTAKYSNKKTAAIYEDRTNLYATWKMQPLELKLSRADDSDPYCNTLKITIGNKNDEGKIAYTYQWYQDDVAIKGATDDEYTISETATYKCVVTASAEGFDTISGEKSASASYKVAPKIYVAEVNGEQFETLSEAVAAANELGVATVKLLKNVTLGEKLTISGNVTIKGEYTITRADDYTDTLFTVNKGAELTLDGGLVIDGGNEWSVDMDAYNKALAETTKGTFANYVTPEEGGVAATAPMFSVSGTVNANDVTIQNVYKNSGTGVFDIKANAVLNMKSATIRHIAANGSNAVAYLTNGSVWTINEGTLIDGNFGGGNGGLCRNDSGLIVMNGGTIQNSMDANGNGSVFMMYGGTFEMNGGTICSNTATNGVQNGRNSAVYLHSNGKMTMTGGSICHNTGTSFGGIDTYKGSAALTITGGMVYDNVSIDGWTRHDVNMIGNTAISGGWYSQDVTEYCAEGYTAIKEYNEDLKQELYHVVDYIAWVKAQLLAGNDVKLIQDIKIDDYSYVNALKLPSNGNGKYDERHGNGAVFHVTKPGVVLDLNGYDIIWDAHNEAYCNARQVSLFMVTATGNEGETAELNIVDSLGDSKVEVYGMASGLYSVCVGAKGTIEGGTWTNYPCNTCKASNIFLYPSHGGELYITGGTFEQKDSKHLLGWNGSSKETTNNGVGSDQDESLFSITGGTFVGQNPELTKFFDTAYGGKESTINAVAEGYKAIEVKENVWVVNPFVSVTVTVNDVTYVEGNPVPTEFTYTTDVECPKLDITYTVDGDVINATVTEMDGYKFTVVPGKLVKEKALVRVDVSKSKEQKFFVSLQEALDFAAAQTVACNVFLLDNITVTEPIVYTDTKADNVELQSIKTGKNTYTLTSTCDEALFTVNGGRFAVKNLNINAKGDAFYVNSGSLTLQGAYQGKQELYVTSETGNCVYVRGGSVSIRGNVYLTANGEYPAIQGNGNYVGNVTFGDWIAADPGEPQVSAPNSDMAIYWPGNGNLTIGYGVFTGDTAVYAKSGKITITGGKFYGKGEAKAFVHSSNGAYATGDALVIENCKDAAYETPVVSITGGTFISDNAKSVAVYNCNESTKVEKFISGGYFDVEPAADLPIEGYETKRFNAELWTVGPVDGVITVDGVWFAGWDEAETAFVQDCVIKLYGDVFNTGDCKALSGKGNVTLDLNGYTLSTPTKGVNTIWVSNKTVLNVIDSTGGGKIAMGSMSYPLNAYTNGKVIFAKGIQFIGSLQSTNGSGSFFFGETELLGANGIFQTNGKTARIGIQENGDWAVTIGSLTMTDNFALTDNTLNVNKNCSINLNGNDLTAKNISVFGNLIDTADGVGTVTAEKLWFNGHNNGGYLPLKDEAVGGYRLFATELVNKGGREQTATFVKFGFTVKLNKTNAYELLDKAAQNGMLTANASWTAAGETEEKSFEYSENALRNHAIAALAQLEAGKTVTSTMILNIYGETALTSGDQVTGYAELSTDTGVVIGSETVTYTKN